MLLARHGLLFLFLLLLVGCGPGLCLDSCNTGTFTFSNLKNLGTVQTGFARGTAIVAGATAVVGCQYDGGTIVAATGTADWKCALPITWAVGSRHTIAVGILVNGALRSAQSIQVIKGDNKDFNGDGYSDMVVSKDGVNMVNIYLSQGSDGIAATPSATLSGTVNTIFGNTLALGDVNGDGFADLVVGAPQFPVTGTDRGAVHLFLSQGGAGIASAASLSLFDPTATNNDQFGISMALGDVNGDGKADLIVGAMGVNSYQGAAYLYLSQGNTGFNAMPSVSLFDPAATPNDYFGMTAMGDVNGDGYTDVVVGASHFSSNKGAAYLYLSQGPAGIANTPNLSLFQPSAANNDYYGGGVAMGDLNGDGYMDLGIGAVGRSSNRGAVYIYYSQGTSGIVATPSLSLLDPAATNGDYFGGVVSVGDVNGDSFTDLAVGSTGFSGSKGAAYVFLSQGLAGLASAPNSSLVGASSADGFSTHLALGDMNGDGYADLAVGADGYSGFGAVFLYRSKGNAGITAPYDVPMLNSGGASGDYFSWAISL